MQDRDKGGVEPRWLRLAADLRAEPDSATLVGLLVASAWAGNAWLSDSSAERPDAGALVSALLGEDGSFGLAVDAGNGGEPRATDSTGAER